MKYLLIFGLVLLLLVLAWFAWQLYKVFFRGYAPLVSTGPKILMRVMEVLNPRGDFAGKKVYELGCGRAFFLREFERMYPKAKLIGVEHDYLVYFISLVQLMFQRSRIKIVRKDLFRVNLSEADVIYCYLNKPMMEELEAKVKFECQMRTQVICHQFPFPNLRADKVIEVEGVKVKKGFENKVYFYEL